jgi:hypothetical protein
VVGRVSRVSRSSKNRVSFCDRMVNRISKYARLVGLIRQVRAVGWGG